MAGSFLSDRRGDGDDAMSMPTCRVESVDDIASFRERALLAGRGGGRSVRGGATPRRVEASPNSAARRRDGRAS